MSNHNEIIVTSKTLTEELNEERKKEGLNEIRPINGMKGMSTGAYACKDRSFNSSLDFFMQMFGKKNK